MIYVRKNPLLFTLLRKNIFAAQGTDITNRHLLKSFNLLLQTSFYIASCHSVYVIRPDFQQDCDNELEGHSCR